VLEIVATEQPDRFLQIAASLVPKGIELAVEQNSGQLTPALYALLDTCLWSTPNAREMEPSEVFEFVAAALTEYIERRPLPAPTEHACKLGSSALVVEQATQRTPDGDLQRPR